MYVCMYVYTRDTFVWQNIFYWVLFPLRNLFTLQFRVCFKVNVDLMSLSNMPRKSRKYANLQSVNASTAFQVIYLKQGCQIFLGTIYQNGGKYTQRTSYFPNGHRKRPFQFQGPSKFTQIGTFGLKLNHLATLISSVNSKRGACLY
jgi:hypothetical protein